jgi:hypothetical protein
MKARKKPVEIECYKWDASDVSGLNKFFPESMNWFTHLENKTWMLEIPTLEGKMMASEGDIIIKGVNGEFYPCKPDIFEKTYEVIEK